MSGSLAEALLYMIDEQGRESCKQLLHVSTWLKTFRVFSVFRG